jgi:hypothetical protein
MLLLHLRTSCSDELNGNMATIAGWKRQKWIQIPRDGGMLLDSLERGDLYSTYPFAFWFVLLGVRT